MDQTTTFPAPNAAAPVRNPIVPILAAWLIPGAGHFMMKRAGRGALIFGSVILMFLFGLSMRGMMFTPEKGSDYLTTLINYGGTLCNLAAGGVYILSAMFGYSQPDLPGDSHDYGTKFLVTAGLLNILAMVDAWEIAKGKKD